MCGVAGFVDKKKRLTPPEINEQLKKMLEAIKHRGNDAHGTYINDNVGIIHARLSIIDLSNIANQPMQNESGDTVISFNGELYNHLEVRERLEKKYLFKSPHSDTETLLHAYEDSKEKCLNDFRGMFAFAIFDRKREEVFLAVDRFGIKPLYYIDTPDWFAWASEIKALLTLEGVTAELNHEALGEHLVFRSVAGPATLFRQIHKLLPAEMLVYDLKTSISTISPYWELSKQSASTVDGSEKMITEMLERSVKEHMLADVPLGVQLSGGVDSSFIAAMVKKNIPKKQELHSFSIGLAEEAWNEFKFSRLVVAQLGTTHHEIIFTEEEFCAALPIATYHLDEPINHSHSIPMMLLAQHAAKHVKVLMSGEGADEVFGGYRRYVEFVKKDKHTSDDFLYENAFSTESLMRSLIHGDVRFDYSYRKKLLTETSQETDVYRLGAYDLATYVTPLLVRQDKMGMKSTLENRVPFLDHEVVLAGLHLADTEKISDGEAKYLLKKIAAKFVPPEIVYRPKIGFSQPIGVWLKNKDGLGKYLRFFTHPKAKRDIFNYEQIKLLVDEHTAGAKDHSASLWILINLELWMKIFLDGENPESVWTSLDE